MAKKSENQGKGKAAEKAAKANGTPQKKDEKTKGKEELRITKKSIIVDLLSRKSGATIQQMGEAITKAGLGDLEQNLKTAKLWLPKLGFAITKDDKGRYFKAA